MDDVQLLGFGFVWKISAIWNFRLDVSETLHDWMVFAL